MNKALRTVSLMSSPCFSGKESVKAGNLTGDLP